MHRCCVIQVEDCLLKNANRLIPQRKKKRRFKRHNTQVYITRCYYEKKMGMESRVGILRIFFPGLSRLSYMMVKIVMMVLIVIVVEVVMVMVVIVVVIVVLVIVVADHLLNRP